MSTGAGTFAAIDLLSGGMSAFSQLQAGKDTQKGYEYNAKLAEQDADLIRTGASLDESRARKGLSSFVGRQVAAYGSSGVELTGSPLDVISDTIANAEMDIAINNFNADIAARGKESQASMSRYYGQQEAKAGKIKAINTFLASAGKTAGKFYNPLQTKSSGSGTQVYTGGKVKSGDYLPFKWEN